MRDTPTHKAPEQEAERWGVYVGAGLGGVKTIEDTYTRTGKKGPRHGFSPYFVTDLIINMAPGLLSIRTERARSEYVARFGVLHGNRILSAKLPDSIRWGECDVMIAGWMRIYDYCSRRRRV